jgi:hypothetical protein
MVEMLSAHMTSSAKVSPEPEPTPSNEAMTTTPAASLLGEPPSWEYKEWAIRVFTKADANADGYLCVTELSTTMKKPKFAQTALENFDIDQDGRISLADWLTSHHKTFEMSAAAARSALKGAEAQLDALQAAEAEAQQPPEPPEPPPAQPGPPATEPLPAPPQTTPPTTPPVASKGAAAPAATAEYPVAVPRRRSLLGAFSGCLRPSTQSVASNDGR